MFTARGFYVTANARECLCQCTNAYKKQKANFKLTNDILAFAAIRKCECRRCEYVRIAKKKNNASETLSHRHKSPSIYGFRHNILKGETDKQMNEDYLIHFDNIIIVKYHGKYTLYF